MTIHLNAGEGAAKCGCNIYKSWDTGEKKISQRVWIRLTDNREEATCKRCKGEVKTAETLTLNKNYVGQIFHYSFGYDMTINVYAKCIRQSGKTLYCKECYANVKDDCGRGAGRAVAGGIKEDEKEFKMSLKKSRWGHEYFAGQRRHWWLWDGKENYHNTWD
jgi:hypothetical protein